MNSCINLHNNRDAIFASLYFCNSIVTTPLYDNGRALEFLKINKQGGNTT
jgi:hypothetical protein